MLRRILFLLMMTPLSLFAAELVPIGWGIVATYRTTLYNKTGEEMGALTGGELFTVYREVKMNKAPAYYVEVESTKKPRGILSAADCRYFPGELPTADDIDALAEYNGRRKLCKDYFSLCATRDKLVESKREVHLKNSPAKQLPKLKAELAAIPGKDRQYEAALKKAKNDSQRIKYRDLRKELRYEASGLRQEIQRLEEEVASWEQTHPFDDTKVKQSAVWKRLNAQAEKLRPSVEALCEAFASPVPTAEQK